MDIFDKTDMPSNTNDRALNFELSGYIYLEDFSIFIQETAQRIVENDERPYVMIDISDARLFPTNGLNFAFKPFAAIQDGVDLTVMLSDNPQGSEYKKAIKNAYQTLGIPESKLFFCYPAEADEERHHPEAKPYSVDISAES